MSEPTKSSINREAAKVKEVASEYQKKGFQVVVEPSQSDLPKALQNLNFQPDMIALSHETNLVIEVRTFESIKNTDIASLAKKVGSIDGWEFELVYTNPKNTYRLPAASATTLLDAQQSLQRAAKFLDTDASTEYADAALLLIWSAVENALRTSYRAYKPNDKITTPWALIRDSVIMGIIGKNDQQFLESMMAHRNELLHGAFNKAISKKDLKKLVELGTSILGQVV